MNHSWLSTADGLKKLLLFLFPDPKEDTAVSGTRNGSKIAAARISHTVIYTDATIIYLKYQVTLSGHQKYHCQWLTFMSILSQVFQLYSRSCLPYLLAQVAKTVQ